MSPPCCSGTTVSDGSAGNIETLTQYNWETNPSQNILETERCLTKYSPEISTKIFLRGVSQNILQQCKVYQNIFENCLTKYSLEVSHEIFFRNVSQNITKRYLTKFFYIDMSHNYCLTKYILNSSGMKTKGRDQSSNKGHSICLW